MIDLMLQQLRKISFGFDRLLQSSVIQVLYFDLSRPRNADHQIGEAETVIPQFHSGITGPDDFGIDKRSAESDRLHSNKYHAVKNTDLRRCFPSPVPRRLAKACKRVAKFSGKKINLERSHIIYDCGFAPEKGIANLKVFSARHNQPRRFLES